MTRIFTDGAEMGDVLFFSWTDGGNLVATGGFKASGDFSYEFDGYDAAAYKSITGISELYFRQRLYVANPKTADRYVAFRNGGTTLCSLATNALQQWVLLVSGSTVGTSLNPFLSNTWYCIEIYLKVDDAPNGRFVLKVDGNTFIDFTGDTKPGAATTIDNIYWAQLEITITSDFYIDDLALNDTAGGVDDSWCGGGRVLKITPNGNGSLSEWTGSDGNNVDNYLMVDEYPSDGDTTYVYEDASATGDLDQYALSDYVGTDRAVERIWAECRARKTSADPATLKIGFDTGASVTTDDVGTLYETYSTRCVGPEYADNPDDAAAWEEADLDALEFVAEVG